MCGKNMMMLYNIVNISRFSKVRSNKVYIESRANGMWWSPKYHLFDTHKSPINMGWFAKECSYSTPHFYLIGPHFFITNHKTFNKTLKCKPNITSFAKMTVRFRLSSSWNNNIWNISQIIIDLNLSHYD